MPIQYLLKGKGYPLLFKHISLEHRFYQELSDQKRTYSEDLKPKRIIKNKQRDKLIECGPTAKRSTWNKERIG